jgi:hypothetical protein
VLKVEIWWHVKLERMNLLPYIYNMYPEVQSFEIALGVYIIWIFSKIAQTWSWERVK